MSPTRLRPIQKVILFFAFAYGLTWAAWLPMAVWFPHWKFLHPLGSLGPLAAAIITAYLTEGYGGAGRVLGQSRAGKSPGTGMCSRSPVHLSCMSWPLLASGQLVGRRPRPAVPRNGRMGPPRAVVLANRYRLLRVRRGRRLARLRPAGPDQGRPEPGWRKRDLQHLLGVVAPAAFLVRVAAGEHGADHDRRLVLQPVAKLLPAHLDLAKHRTQRAARRPVSWNG